jgi:hypothetical protein
MGYYSFGKFSGVGVVTVDRRSIRRGDRSQTIVDFEPGRSTRDMNDRVLPVFEPGGAIRGNDEPDGPRPGDEPTDRVRQSSWSGRDFQEDL